MTISELQHEAHALAVGKGFYDTNPSIPERLALIHAEVSEALEDYRNGKMAADYQGAKPTGFPSELADIIIRVADLAGHLEIDLEMAIVVKHAYNKVRPYRHGGKKC